MCIREVCTYPMIAERPPPTPERRGPPGYWHELVRVGLSTFGWSKVACLELSFCLAS
jgi:hypothetical protein